LIGWKYIYGSRGWLLIRRPALAAAPFHDGRYGGYFLVPHVIEANIGMDPSKATLHTHKPVPFNKPSELRLGDDNVCSGDYIS
jgi:hypothetical protein